jgi:hypothetical protein
MTRLIIRCPARPITNDAQAWSLQDLYFSWMQVDHGDFQKVLDLDVCPVADHVLAIIPGIDLRIIELKVPAVNTKKLIQILPMLIEDDLLSSVTETRIQLLPPLSEQQPDRRLVSVMDRDWLLWLSQKLAVINCEKIQLISESMLLPPSDSILYFQQEDATRLYTSKPSPYETTCWSQPEKEPLLVIRENNGHTELLEISAAILINGIETEKKSYESTNLLPDEFYEFRTERQSEVHHWVSRDLWKSPLRWTKYATLTLCIGYLCYVMALLWQDLHWEATLAKAANQVLSESMDSKESFKRLVSASCTAAHKNLENCGGDFERMLLALQNLLNGLPPEALKAVVYSEKGLVFELQQTALSDNQRFAILQDNSIRRLGPESFLLSPYAKLTDD